MALKAAATQSKQEREMQKQTQDLTIKELEITIGSNIITVKDLVQALENLGLPQFLKVIHSIIQEVGGDQLKLLIDGVEIQMTESAFSKANQEQLPTLEKVAEKYPFTKWLDEMGIDYTRATRSHLCTWWDSFMLMAAEHGYQAMGINQVNRSDNLWKATANLAAKMQLDPAAYGYLPALLINHPQEVSRVLSSINEPAPFLEVLTGEVIHDMRKCEAFMGAFCTVRTDGEVVRSIPNAVFSVGLCLQRPERSE